VEQAYGLACTRYFWIVDYLCDYSGWDFLWEPAPWESEYRHAFASQWQKDSGTYLVPTNGYSHTKYNKHQVTRLPSNVNWESVNFDFDFSWHPDPTESPYIYQFATQHQKTGGPRYIVPGAKNTKFVGEIKSTTAGVATGVVIIAHTFSEHEIATNLPVVQKTRFISDYLGTLRRICNKIKDHEYIWVVSDLCDYTNFDFTWHPEIWQNTMLHVFPSNEQKFGDTFFIHVESFLEKSQDLEVLEWYNPLNFVQEHPVPRIDPQEIKFDSDSLVDAVLTHTFTEPVVQFYRHKPESPMTISLWQERLRTVAPLSKSGEATIIPKDVKNHIQTQIYDYPWIDRSLQNIKPGTSQDIVYISYDEPEAEKNYQLLLELTKNLPNKVTRVHGVTGMENALKAAAEASSTPWVYSVFAKTELDKNFNFDFVPDYLQSPKHYIFNCRNSSNGLVYGHMGVIMYNCKIVKNAPPYEQLGLDYTVSFPVQVVPVLSCYGNFATSPYHAWRTAFRECAKLSYFNSIENNVENDYRLDVWTSHAEGNHAQWVLRGAQDGVEFFTESKGKLDYLKQSFRWEYLREYFSKKYGDLT